MRSEYKSSIKEAKRLLRITNDVAHGYAHAKRVAADARTIAKALSYPDIDLVEVCAWWHDVGRLYNANHEKLSARLMSLDLKKRGIDYKIRQAAYRAVYKHRWNMHPRTVQGQIIKDADKLDFISVKRWQVREATGGHKNNMRNLERLPYIRKNLSFNISKRLFDDRLGEFAENLEHSHIPTQFFAGLQSA